MFLFSFNVLRLKEENTFCMFHIHLKPERAVSCLNEDEADLKVRKLDLLEQPSVKCTVI